MILRCLNQQISDEKDPTTTRLTMWTSYLGCIVLNVTNIKQSEPFHIVLYLLSSLTTLRAGTPKAPSGFYCNTSVVIPEQHSVTILTIDHSRNNSEEVCGISKLVHVLNTNTHTMPFSDCGAFLSPSKLARSFE